MPDPKNLLNSNHNFTRLTGKPQRKTFYATLPSTPRWWEIGNEKDPEIGWLEVFDRDLWLCVFCRQDLVESPDTLAHSTEDHLVPRSLLSSLEGKKPNIDNNLAACCSGCNALKGDYVPLAHSRAWSSRENYILACSEFIEKRRAERLAKHHQHRGRAAKVRLKELGPSVKNILNSIAALETALPNKHARRHLFRRAIVAALNTR